MKNDDFIEWEVNVKKKVAKEKRMVAFDRKLNETYINYAGLPMLDFILTPHCIEVGKKVYVPVSYLIEKYSGDTKENYKKIDADIRKWAEEEEVK